MQKNELIKEITQRECRSGLFDIKINDVGVYNYINRSILRKMLDYHNFGLNYKNPNVNNKERKKNLRKSFCQLLSLFVHCKKYENIIRSFERVDFINGSYVDKFTDPLVDYTDIGKNCLILEHGRSGRHLTPRCHFEKIIYTDIIYWLAWKFISIRKKRFYKKHSDEIDLLFSKIESTFPEIEINKDTLFTTIVRSCFITSCYKRLFKRVKAKSFFAPSRASFKHIIPAAKTQGLKVYELQHGLTYANTLTYTGFHDPLFTPDFFLSFGKIHSACCYGIEPERIIEIGWGFERYFKDKQEKSSHNNVLVISDPDVSRKVISVVCKLAESNPDIIFNLRPHPLEILDTNTLSNLSKIKNIVINDNLENIAVVLMRFDCVLGVNSTVLYEALAFKKKVGRLDMEGLDIKFLDEEDKKYFYMISDEKSFIEFINSPFGEKPSLNIYTPFNPETINKLLM
jgi:hypothetical protein